jgi:hypothetical protein
MDPVAKTPSSAKAATIERRNGGLEFMVIMRGMV